ncbi:MAG TPA: protein kinase [Syntrophomonadaceae bacterium]|nr:protein kinase [Syntrophomonadaceae bacterium]
MIRCPVCTSENLDDKKFCGECGVNLIEGLTGRLNADSLLESRYRIIRTIGRGGMGAVYLALDQRLNNMRVAIKEMSTNAVGRGNLLSAISSFKKEAAILIDLRHPALPRVIDFFPRGVDRWYLVMDFIEGKNLSTVLNERGRIEEPEVLDWTSQICEILDFLHGQDPSIIFRDLKPSNIMLNPQGQIKLVDFGIARHFRPGVGSDTAAYGSTGFAPPEQYGDRQTNIRSDIYALGATLHFLLTGVDPKSNPFIFEEPAQYVKISPRINAAIMKSLEFRPENRPENIAHFWELITGETWPEHLVQHRRVLRQDLRSPGIVKPDHPAQILLELNEETGSSSGMEEIEQDCHSSEYFEEIHGQSGTLSFEENDVDVSADEANRAAEEEPITGSEDLNINGVGEADEQPLIDIEVPEPQTDDQNMSEPEPIRGKNILVAATEEEISEEDTKTGTLLLSCIDSEEIEPGTETKLIAGEDSSTSTLALQLDDLPIDQALENLISNQPSGIKSDQASSYNKPPNPSRVLKEKEKPKAIKSMQQKKQNKRTVIVVVVVLIISITVAAVIRSNKKQPNLQSPIQSNTTTQTNNSGTSSASSGDNSQPTNSITEKQPASTTTTPDTTAKETGGYSAPSSGSSTKPKTDVTPPPSSSDSGGNGSGNSVNQPQGETYDNRPNGETYDYRI